MIANRGLSGIDGTVSTAIGAALGRPRSSRAIALMGDVTFLHDANGLVLGPDQPRPTSRSSSSTTTAGRSSACSSRATRRTPTASRRLFGTPHGVDLASLCAATRTPHWKVDTLAELEHALASPNGGIEVVEAGVGRDNRRELDARIRALASDLSRPRPARMRAWRPQPSWSRSGRQRAGRHGDRRAGSTSRRRCSWSWPGSRRPTSPACRRCDLEPEVVLLGLLPPLLYAAAISAPRWSTSTPTGGRSCCSRSAWSCSPRSASPCWCTRCCRSVGWPAAFAIGAVVAPPGRGRGDRDRPPDRAAAADRHDPRGRVAAQRRDRAGRRCGRRSRPAPPGRDDDVDHPGGGARLRPRRRRRRARSASRRSSWSPSSASTSPTRSWTPRSRWSVPFAAYIAAEEIHGVRRDRGGGRGPAARPQGADPADRPVADRRADELAHHRVHPREHRLPADRPAGRVAGRRRRSRARSRPAGSSRSARPRSGA